MTLTARLLAFFLTALAVVLVAFSTGLWLLTRAYLDHHVKDHLAATLDLLASCIEATDDEGMEWEPNGRHLLPIGDAPDHTIVWNVVDESENLIDSGGSRAAAEVLKTSEGGTSEIDGSFVVSQDGSCWRIARRAIRQADLPPRQEAPDPTEPSGRFKSLVIAAGASLAHRDAMLRNLAAASAGLSAAFWLLAAGTGWRLTRRALAPLAGMSEAVRSIRPSELGRRVPLPATRDELEELARAFNGMLNNVQEAFLRQQRFTGDASHQLRTPLTAMLGQVEVALRRDRSTDDYRKVLADLKSQIVHVQQILESLLFLARADGETSIPDRQVVDLAEWVAAQMRRWSIHPRAADFRVEANSETALPSSVHPPLLGQLFDNLLDNACKYSEPGTPIVVRATASEQFCRLLIEDEGCGIPAPDLPHVFEPFYRSPQARRNGRHGTGLGLAVAQRIASSFGGRILASSEGLGSTFTLELPKTPQDRAVCVS